MSISTDPAASYGPSLDDAGNLRAGKYDKSAPAWARINRAWNTMPAAINMSTTLRPGMTVDEAMHAEGERVEEFAERLNGIFQRHESEQAELRLLRGQRDSLRALLGL